MKRTLCLLLAVIMALSACTLFVFADDEPDYEPVTEETTTEVTEQSGLDTEEEVTEEPATQKSDKVARLWLCSLQNNLVAHVFIYVENISDEPINVGLYTCPPGEGVSVGTFGMTVSDGPGVYYNIEGYRNRNVSVPPRFIAINREITKNQLDNVSSYIRSANWWDPIAVNCCFFAIMCWDKSGGTYIFPMTCLPSIARLQIQLRSPVKTISLPKPDRNNVYKQRGNNLVVVSEGSLS